VTSQSARSAEGKAGELRRLHKDAGTFVLPNAWDAASAVVFERAGARAIGTTSAGIANALGYSDGEAHVPPDEMLWVVAHIARAVDLPVTADIEGGYGDIAGTAAAALAAGAVGLNLEDHVDDDPGVIPLQQAVDAIAEARDAGARTGIDVVVNARTDAILRGGTVTEAIGRGRAFLEAGADCVFVVGVKTGHDIAALVNEIPGPVNVLAGSGGLSVAQLAGLGVRRVSLGSTAFTESMTTVHRLAVELLSNGQVTESDDGAIPNFNRIFQMRSSSR
jgi:2-methylisocitrate lyase-like PEP mutase family enzyme